MNTALNGAMAWTVDIVPDIVFWGVISMALALSGHVVGMASWYLGFPCLWILSSGVCLLFSSLKITTSGKAVLITGCDTGFGHALAFHLHNMGFRVFAGCLLADESGEGAEALRREDSERLHVLQMDVTKEKEIQRAFQDVLTILPKGEVLWGLVNNAGVTGVGLLEWVPLEKYREVAEVNIFGVLSVTKAFLPLVRRAQGRVVNLSSVTGCIGRRSMSAYTLTKFAVEGISDSLRDEMRSWGVNVSIVQPGNFSAGTNISTKENVEKQGVRMWSTMSEVVKADYGKEYFDHMINMSKAGSASGSTDIAPVLKALTAALTQRYPRARYRAVDWYYLVKVWAAVHLPEWVFELVYVGQPSRLRCGSRDVTDDVIDDVIGRKVE